jgi:hypothetical protein
MGHEFALRRPNDASGLIINIDNQFPDDHPIPERYHSCARLKPGIDDETRDQSGVQRADIAERSPNRAGVRLG